MTAEESESQFGPQRKRWGQGKLYFLLRVKRANSEDDVTDDTRKLYLKAACAEQTYKTPRTFVFKHPSIF